MRRMWIVWCLIVLLAVVFVYRQNEALCLTRTEVEVGLAGPVRLVQLSDLHGKRFGQDNSRLIEMVKAEQPDLIVFTGDLISSDDHRIERGVQVLLDLTQVAPVYYIAGNHEQRSGDLPTIEAALRAGGVTVLHDSFAQLQVGQTTVHLLGLVEAQGSKEAYAARRAGTFTYIDNGALLGQLADREGLRILLSHFPENFSLTGDCRYDQYDFDFMLSGHAHGGQFVLPLVGAVYAPGQGLFPRYTEGWYGDGPRMYVSRGLGASSFPLRLFTNPEVVSIEVR